MADNVAITAGSGTNIAADDVSSVYYQKVKLDGGGDGATTPILAGNGTAAGALRVTLPTDGTGVVGLNAGTNNIGDVDVLTLPGTAAEGAALPSVFVVAAGDDGTDTQPIQLNAAGDVKVTLDSEAVVLGAGTAEIGKLAAGTANIGDVDVLTVPSVAGEAASTFNATSSDGATALTNSAQSVKGSAGSLKGWYCYNPNTSAQFVQFYNTASGSVTVGTTNPLFMLTIPAGSAANLWLQPGGIAFGTAISIAATSTAGGNGAPTTALDVVVWYV